MGFGYGNYPCLPAVWMGGDQTNTKTLVRNICHEETY